MKRILTLTILLLSAAVFAQKTYLHCGKLIDVEQGEILSEMTIIVEGEKIISVEKGFTKAGPEDQTIDLKSKTVIPGLMDMHVHIESQYDKGRYARVFQNNPADIAFGSTVYAKNTLMAGFTSVRDLGGTGVNISLKKAIKSGLVDGPRIFTAGKTIATTGGHGDPTNGYRADLMGNPGPNEGVINSPAEARQAVRQRYKNGADVIKITATGGVLSVAKDGSGPQFTMDELKAIVETANEYGMLTAAHAHGQEGMRRAVEAGIKTIEHGTLMTEEVMDLMKEKGTFLVPTISAGKFVADKAKIPGFYPPVIVPKALMIGPKLQDTFGRAYQKGVNIVFGTDAGVFPHGENGKEFGYMVEAGMPAMETIQSATITPAKLLKVDDELGSITKGKYADMIAVDADPTKNIKTMENVTFVMKGGVIYKE